MGQYSCEFCSNYVYDEEYEEYGCVVSMDEDDYARFCASEYKNCPYYQSNDEYKIVRHQMQDREGRREWKISTMQC